jgi:hypothetical protein
MLSITPKVFLHELLADHKDAPSCNDAKLYGPCIHKQGYSCQQSDLVVTKVYLVGQSQEVVRPPNFCFTANLSYSSPLTKNFVTHSQERAPPAHV